MEHNITVQIYQTYVDSLIAHENKRLQSNAMYGASSLAIAGLLPDITDLRLVYITLAVIGILWFNKILYYRSLSKAKFFAINEIEKNLDQRPFQMEWTHFKENKIIPTELTWIELCVPALQFLVSVLLFAIEFSR